MIEKIQKDGELLSIIIRSNYVNKDITFFTNVDSPQQLAYMNWPKSHCIKPHIHNYVIREIGYTQEVLIIKSGKVRVDFYDKKKNYFESRILCKEDIILLASGGHGMKMLENSEIIEVKQGPYAGDKDKVRFEAANEKNIKVV